MSFLTLGPLFSQDFVCTQCLEYSVTDSPQIHVVWTKGKGKEEERVGRKEGPMAIRTEEGKGENAFLNLRNTRSVHFPDFLVNLRNLIVATEKRNFVVHGFCMAISVHTVLLIQSLSSFQ